MGGRPSTDTVRLAASAGVAAVASVCVLTLLPRLRGVETGSEAWEVCASVLRGWGGCYVPACMREFGMDFFVQRYGW